MTVVLALESNLSLSHYICAVKLPCGNFDQQIFYSTCPRNSGNTPYGVKSSVSFPPFQVLFSADLKHLKNVTDSGEDTAPKKKKNLCKKPS